jgi:uncharacterized protein (UPF0332 family)
MDLNYNLYLERANNEIKLADIILFVSGDKNLQINTFKIEEPDTYYSAVISHAYYCIFYSAKAYLMKKGIRTKMPNEHKKTYELFKRFVRQGVLDKELLRLYEDVLIKAETLLNIFKIEKKNRGEFTYQKLAQANKDPASKSLENAKIFFKSIYNLTSI